MKDAASGTINAWTLCDKVQQIGGELKRTRMERLTYNNVSDICACEKMTVNNMYIYILKTTSIA